MPSSSQSSWARAVLENLIKPLSHTYFLTRPSSRELGVIRQSWRIKIRLKFESVPKSVDWSRTYRVCNNLTVDRIIDCGLGDHLVLCDGLFHDVSSELALHSDSTSSLWRSVLDNDLFPVPTTQYKVYHPMGSVNACLWFWGGSSRHWCFGLLVPFLHFLHFQIYFNSFASFSFDGDILFLRPC